jgi:hypothetical protein
MSIDGGCRHHDDAVGEMQPVPFRIPLPYFRNF